MSHRKFLLVVITLSVVIIVLLLFFGIFIHDVTARSLKMIKNHNDVVGSVLRIVTSIFLVVLFLVGIAWIFAWAYPT